MSPFAFVALQFQTARLIFDIQTVMTLRLLGMSGAIPAHADENFMMISEKGPAMMRALVAGNAALMTGKSPDKVIGAAIGPLARKVSANRRRLMR